VEAQASSPHTIEPLKRWPLPDLRDLAEHRDLLFLLARRDVAVRYKQSVAGVLWALLQPLLLAAVFAVFFGLLQKVDSEEGVPYPLFVVVGLVLWLFISNAVQASSESTVESKELIRKVYFPRMLVPIAAIAPAAVDFAIGLVVAIVFAASYGFLPGPQTLALPLVFLLAAVTVVGVGLWLSALNVRYRDVHLAVPFLILLGLFLSPVIYPVDIVPDHLQALYALNPMVGLFEAFRWSLLDTPFPGLIILISIGVSLLLLVTGAIYFQRAEQTFADVV
jgi:lipopolysaccharide transport system permease protein